MPPWPENDKKMAYVSLGKENGRIASENWGGNRRRAARADWDWLHFPSLQTYSQFTDVCAYRYEHFTNGIINSLTVQTNLNEPHSVEMYAMALGQPW